MNRNLFIQSKRSTDDMVLSNFQFSERAKNGHLCLLLETLTGYARILDWRKDQHAIQHSLSQGFVIAEVREYLGVKPRSEYRARQYLENHLHELRKDLEWIDCAEEFERENTGSSPDFIPLYEKREQSAMCDGMTFALQLRMALINGD